GRGDSDVPCSLCLSQNALLLAVSQNQFLALIPDPVPEPLSIFESAARLPPRHYVVDSGTEVAAFGKNEGSGSRRRESGPQPRGSR
ncbi:hypothetical protein GDO78_004770, partial [Eleutherodactylus coqui]